MNDVIVLSECTASLAGNRLGPYLHVENNTGIYMLPTWIPASVVPLWLERIVESVRGR